jgi:hypothetical protein
MIPHPTDPRHPWSRLTKAARTVRDARDTSAPYGFATRVAALALGQESRVASLLDLIALRALGVACLLAVLSIAVNYSEVSRRLAGPAGAGSSDDVLLPISDTVSVVLDLAD